MLVFGKPPVEFVIGALLDEVQARYRKGMLKLDDVMWMLDDFLRHRRRMMWIVAHSDSKPRLAPSATYAMAVRRSVDNAIALGITRGYAGDPSRAWHGLMPWQDTVLQEGDFGRLQRWATVYHPNTVVLSPNADSIKDDPWGWNNLPTTIEGVGLD